MIEVMSNNVALNVFNSFCVQHKNYRCRTEKWRAISQGSFFIQLSDNEGKGNLNLKALIEKYCKKCGALIKLKNLKAKMKETDLAP